MSREDATPKTPNYAAWQIELLTEAVSREEFLKHLVSWSILAASSHNTQPWRFVVRPTTNIIDICLDSHFVLPASDKAGRQAAISIGCTLENLLTAVDYYGSWCSVKYPLCTEGYPLPFVTVQVGDPTMKGGLGVQIMNAMRQRRMNRTRFNEGKKVPSLVIEEMQKIVGRFGLSFSAITDRFTRSAMAEAQYAADNAVVALAKFRNELGDFLRPNDTLEGRCMPGATFDFDDELAEKIHRALLGDGQFDTYLADAFPAGDREAFLSAPLIGVIGAPEDKPSFWVSAGRALERCALLAELEGLDLSVHAAMVEESILNTALKMRLWKQGRPTVIFRVGYSLERRTARPPHAPRVPLDEVVEISSEERK